MLTAPCPFALRDCCTQLRWLARPTRKMWRWTRPRRPWLTSLRKEHTARCMNTTPGRASRASETWASGRPGKSASVSLEAVAVRGRYLHLKFGHKGAVLVMPAAAPRRGIRRWPSSGCGHSILLAMMACQLTGGNGNVECFLLNGSSICGR